MGLCLCRGSNNGRDSEDDEVDTAFSVEPSEIATVFDARQDYSVARPYSKSPPPTFPILEAFVLDTLRDIPALVDNDREPPPSMTKLHAIAEEESGWLAVVQALVRAIPLDNPHGPAVISLLLDDCPLPAKDTVCQITTLFPIEPTSSHQLSPLMVRLHRNFCILLGCLAEKLPGPTSMALLNKDVLNYLVGNLSPNNDPNIILFSIIALEKFAMTSENKALINQVLLSMPFHPIANLESWYTSPDYLHKQIGFCSQWVLDNLFIQEGRPFTYERINKANLNAMLNTKDVSEYLKISPDGLSARCDASSFESVRCTFQVDKDVYFYEVTLITSGVMQIGWATKNSKFLNYEGYGIGDDEFSLSYDGCRQMIWFNSNCEPHSHPPWKPGDILGSLLNLDNYSIIFYLNGKPLPPCSQVFEYAKSGFFAAASFMSFQQCEFNFGHQPFKFPPVDQPYRTFNSSTTLGEEDKLILPKHIQMNYMKNMNFGEDSCTLCYDGVPNIVLLPCRHTGFCQNCALMLERCPICRAVIQSHQEMT